MSDLDHFQFSGGDPFPNCFELHMQSECLYYDEVQSHPKTTDANGDLKRVENISFEALKLQSIHHLVHNRLACSMLFNSPQIPHGFDQPQTHLQLHHIVKNVVIVAHPNLIATIIATNFGTWISTLSQSILSDPNSRCNNCQRRVFEFILSIKAKR